MDDGPAIILGVARPIGVAALAFFFLFGTMMSGIAAVSLAFPDGPLEPLWQINPRGHDGLVTLGVAVVILMATVSLACLAAAVGLWLGRRWGALLAMTIVAINVAGDPLNAMIARDWRTLIGVPFAAGILYYLTTPRVWAFFAARP